jgi:hypothetical protein
MGVCWTYNGELVDEYSAIEDNPFGILAGFAPGPTPLGSLPTLNAKRQVEGERLKFTPRYPEMLFSIAVTLTILDDFDRNLMKYLYQYQDFLSVEEAGQIAPRVAFLFDLLTYYRMPKQSLAVYQDIDSERNLLGSNSFRNAVIDHAGDAVAVLQSNRDLEGTFQEWVGKRYHKRLWAAVRDYLKEGCEFYTYFQSALHQYGLRDLADRIAQQQDGVLVGVEVPGDVWNLLFFQRIFDADRKIQPRQLRSWFDRLRTKGQLPENAAVERLDVSFRYSPRMCDERRERSCLFRQKSHIWDYCPPRHDIEWKGRPCPVTDHLCGIHYTCEPIGCTVRQSSHPTDLCQGCHIKLLEQTIAP